MTLFTSLAARPGAARLQRACACAAGQANCEARRKNRLQRRATRALHAHAFTVGQQMHVVAGRAQRVSPGSAGTGVQARLQRDAADAALLDRDLSRTVMQQAVCDARNQPVATAKPIVEKTVCDSEPSAQEALDAKEGQLGWIEDSTGAVLDFKATGAKHNDHVKGCDPTRPAPAEEPPKGEPE